MSKKIVEDIYHPIALLYDIYNEQDKLTIFDIGACEGESSIFYSEHFPNATLYTFEPVPSNFSLVKQNTASYNNINPFQIALSNENGTATFHVSSGTPEGKDDNVNYGNKSSSLLSPELHTDTHKWLKFEEKIEVRTQILSDFCQEKNISKIDFIHIDVQGAELMVFEGANQIINAIDCIWMEVEEVELYKGQPLKPDVEKFMYARGFFKILDTTNGLSGDQFYARKEFYIAKRGKIAFYYTFLKAYTAEKIKTFKRTLFYRQASYFKNRILERLGLKK
ncbi:FkbM family methyltransferase [Bernardetia sp.]|uniref:FkbM family methyltransferase n=1 Tax=Bernardetia sp. TaxID=1937974 RepID=UPI0025C582A8|nr:FkbM family methyltransferase [Bernardetia sp.]